VIGVEERHEGLRLRSGGERGLALGDGHDLVVDRVDDEQRTAELGDGRALVVAVEVV
jgi:hypothetical protein